MSEQKKYDTVETENGTYTTVLNKMYVSRKPWQAANPGHVLSFMPGMVVEFSVKPGDKVKKGDLLAIFKAMKMNNKILAPIDGTIKSLNVEAGVNIPKNTLIVEFA